MKTTDLVLRQKVPSVPAALSALAGMRRELSSARTYEQIQKTIKEATALKVLLGHVNEVKVAAEDTIIAAHRRIGEELSKIPKANKHQSSRTGKSTTGIAATSRHRYGKLASTTEKDVQDTVDKLRGEGKDATVRAVVTELTHGDKKTRRETRQKELATKIRALPEKRYGLIYGDPGWRTETWSPKGMDRAADNHYTTTELDEIKKLDIPSISARDAGLLMWTTVPHLAQAIVEVLPAWGYTYKSMLTWDKEVPGTGHIFLNQTEHLIYATRGDFVAPGEGQRIPSLFRERKTQHSVKPVGIIEWIERTWPDLPKIELNRRGPAREGWDAWGNEATETDQERDTDETDIFS